MKLGLVQDGALAAGESIKQRMDEMITEAVHAEEMGFDFYGLAEVHFSDELTISAPEVLLGLIAGQTTRIRLRTVSTPLLSFNHPIRVAERIATLDLVSNGRAELGAARSNQAHTIEAFGIPVDQTRAQFTDSIDVILKALSQTTFEHEGPVWSVPERSLTPRPLQAPHPPVFVAATSMQTHKFAGEQGLGVMSGNSLPGGWKFVEECLSVYRNAWRDGAAMGRASNSAFSCLALRAHCAETDELALEEASGAAFRIIDLVMRWYTKLAQQSADYSYMSDFEKLQDRRHDLPFLVQHAPYLSIGSPDFLVQRIERLEAMGVDEFMLELDGLGHDRHMKAIELIGREVIPRIGGSQAPTQGRSSTIMGTAQ